MSDRTKEPTTVPVPTSAPGSLSETKSRPRRPGKKQPQPAAAAAAA